MLSMGSLALVPVFISELPSDFLLYPFQFIDFEDQPKIAIAATTVVFTWLSHGSGKEIKTETTHKLNNQDSF